MRMDFHMVVAIFLCLSPFVASASLANFKGLDGRLDVVGGTAHLPVMRKAVERIRTVNPKVVIALSGGGSGVGIQKVAAGLADIGNTGRPLTSSESSKYDLQAFAFAIDGIAIIVHPSNPVSNLSRRQVAEIFSGKILNWSELKGKPGPLRVYHREPDSGTRQTFADFFSPAVHETHSKGSVVMSNGAMKLAISTDPTAIGYLSIGMLDGGAIKGIDLDGVIPSQDNALNRTYPIVRKLYMNVKKSNQRPLVRAFVGYMLSPEVHSLLRDAGLFPIQEGTKQP